MESVSFDLENSRTGVLTESMCDVQVVGHEALKPEAALGLVVCLRSANGDVGAAEER